MIAFENVSADIAEMIDEKKIAGACAAVAHRGRKIFSFYCGYANIEKEIPIDAESVFRIASMTKPVTAAAVLLCREKGLLALEDRVSKYLPEYGELYLMQKKGGKYVRAEKSSVPVTIFQLLTHTSGLASGTEEERQSPPELLPKEGDSLRSVVSRYYKAGLDFIPGTGQGYSPVVAFDVAARIVEIVTGMPYAEFLRRNIFIPLDMRNTTYSLSSVPSGKRVLSYADKEGVLIPDPNPLHNFASYPADYPGGGAGLMSALEDYLHFAEMLAARGTYSGNRILKEESIDLMRKPWLSHKLNGINDYFNWGLGVRTVSKACEDQPLPGGCFGWSGAYGTHFWADPTHGIAAVYMHNSLTYGGSGAPHTVRFEKNVIGALEQLGVL